MGREVQEGAGVWEEGGVQGTEGRGVQGVGGGATLVRKGVMNTKKTS